MAKESKSQPLHNEESKRYNTTAVHVQMYKVRKYCRGYYAKLAEEEEKSTVKNC